MSSSLLGIYSWMPQRHVKNHCIYVKLMIVPPNTAHFQCTSLQPSTQSVSTGNLWSSLNTLWPYLIEFHFIKVFWNYLLSQFLSLPSFPSCRHFFPGLQKWVYLVLPWHLSPILWATVKVTFVKYKCYHYDLCPQLSLIFFNGFLVFYELRWPSQTCSTRFYLVWSYLHL